MTGIFDSIIDEITGIDGAGSTITGLGSALSAGITAFGGSSNQSQSNDYNRYNSTTKLDKTPQSSPYISKAVESVSPEQLEQQWLARLNKFANMSSTTSVKPR